MSGLGTDNYKCQMGQNMTHPAKQFCNQTLGGPAVWAKIRKARERFAVSTACYLSAENIIQVFPSFSVSDAASVSVIAAWEPTQGIYRFDRDLYQALVGSTSEATPIDATPLLTMPEWSVFIETPGMTLDVLGKPGTVIGAWVSLVQASFDAPVYIAVVYLSDDACLYEARISLSMAPLSIVDVIASGTAVGGTAADMMAVAPAVAVVLALALYLCREPDITVDGRPARIPNRRAIKLHRPGAMRPRAQIRDVGVRVGAEIRARREREAREAEEREATGRRMCPHTRRMHRRMVPVGPWKRPDGTKIPAALRPHVERWIPVSHVNCQPGDDLPAVIHRVRLDQAQEAA